MTEMSSAEYRRLLGLTDPDAQSETMDAGEYRALVTESPPVLRARYGGSQTHETKPRASADRTAPHTRDATEEEFQALVVDLARRHGWMVHYTADWVHRLIRADMDNRKRSRDWPDRGFPDLILMKPPRLLIVENKSRMGRLNPGQAEWIAGLRACGVDVRLWRPADEVDIVDVLSGRATA